jgi:hypothetical protein
VDLLILIKALAIMQAPFLYPFSNLRSGKLSISNDNLTVTLHGYTESREDKIVKKSEK